MLYENDAKKLNALNVAENKKNRVTAAQFASNEAIANTLRSPRFKDSIAQNPDIVNTLMPNSTDDHGMNFFPSNTVEETNDLMALHNLNSSELIKTLELGGLPMPSIAVIKSQQGHEKYGDISLISSCNTHAPFESFCRA